MERYLRTGMCMAKFAVALGVFALACVLLEEEEIEQIVSCLEREGLGT